MGTIGVAIDERSNVLVQRFVAENIAARATMDELKVVMEAIGGDRFEAMASKMALLDQTLLDRRSLLSDMFGKNANELRDCMLAHERSFVELYGKLTVLECSAQEVGSGPRGFSGFRFKIPDPAGRKLDVLKGRDDGLQLRRERLDLQTGSFWHGMEKVVVDVEQDNKACHLHRLDPVGD